MELKEGTTQLRVLERRLLSKLRDKTPSDITSLHNLIKSTNNEILDVAHKIEKKEEVSRF